MKLQANEIRDFLSRAPCSNVYDGNRIINYTNVRHEWLDSIHSGSIHARINRRAGICPDTKDTFAPHARILSSIRRNKRRCFQRNGAPEFCFLYA